MFATIVGTVHLGLIVDPDFCSDDLVPSNEQPSNIKKDISAGNKPACQCCCIS